MAVTFKYKNLINQSYAPGVAYPGKDGPAGRKGTTGNSVYFIDYELDNSYSIDLALQKIENNKILTNDSDISINERPYKVNDILISNSGNVYKIIESKSSNSKNYKFDIKFLGKIHHSSESDAIKIVIYDITGLVLIGDTSTNTNVIQKVYSSRQDCCCPTNRSEKFYKSDSFDESDYWLYGTWIKPMLWVGNNLTLDSIDIESRIKYSLILNLSNKKSLGITKIPGSNDNSIEFKLNKKLEFANPGICAINEGQQPTDIIFSEEFLRGITSTGSQHSQYKAIYLSDMFMDRMHPSKNDILCTLNKDRTAWYKTGRDARYNEDNEGNKTYYNYPEDLTYGKDIYDPSTYDPNSDDNITLCKKTLDDYTMSNSFFPLQGQDATTTISLDMFPEFSIDKSVSPISKEFIANAVETYDSTFILNTKKSFDFDKSRSGDSAYFSSIIPKYSYDESIEMKYGLQNKSYIISNPVSDEIFNYISDDENTYELIIKKTKDKTITISDISVEFNTTTFKNKIYKYDPTLKRYYLLGDIYELAN